MNQTPTHQQPAHYESDEIDLFELFQTLWQEKILIILTTLVISVSAGIYAYTVQPQPQYSISMTLKPASLSLYGELVAGMEITNQQGIALARNTTTQVLAQVKDNLELQSNKTKYFTDYNANVNIKSSRNNDHLTIELTTSEPNQASSKLKGYLDYVSELTVHELNAFMKGSASEAKISKEMLYTVDIAAPKSAVQTNKPKKKLIIAVGVVLGGMLGIFIALIRSAISKRRQTVA